MKQYLIRIETKNTALFTTIHGDIFRPFMIAGNLWNYVTPWTAARRLETIAIGWEKIGINVKRIYGTIYDMPTKGNLHNVAITIHEYT